MDPDIKVLFQVLIESQARTDKSIGDLASVLATHLEISDARFVRLDELHARTEQSIAELAMTVDRSTASANARMIRIEENLDGLIRAITREHSNGKSH